MKKAVLIVFIFLFKFNLYAQSGCNDPLATNYNDKAVNDGSCTYPSVSVSPTASFALSSSLAETSGLIEWNGYLYTQNDHHDTNIYQLNKSNGDILKTISLPNVKSIDWEEISQDENYFYIGDTGNNVSGNRTNLKIYKIAKASLAATPQIETIHFSYSNQTDFTASPVNKTDFDCEAFIVTNDGIFLFTKQWLSKKTSIYQLPKNPGTYVANLLTTLDVSGMITGATAKENLNLIALCGYNSMLSPFIYLIYDYKGTDFALSNKRKIKVSLPFHQIEGIATSDGLEYFLTNEKFERSPFINKPQQLHKISLHPYLEKYVAKYSKSAVIQEDFKAVLSTNPSTDEINIKSTNAVGHQYKITDSSGKIVKEGIINSNTLNMGDFPKGIYIFTLPNMKHTYKIIKQ